MITEIANGVYWVGAVDWALRRFHGHELSTLHGSSYNAYLIVDNKVALIDTVWGPFRDVLIEHIKEVIDPAKIDIVVASHAEIDHSGALPAIMAHCPNAQVVVSERGMESFPRHHRHPWPLHGVKTGDSIQLGKRTLSFVEAPMLHWPDNLLTHLSQEDILFSSDALGSVPSSGVNS
ncbi:FprA family A-type flavoprotein [Dehalogenimonas sp. THU2]|uniref:FprA family A-type flavoprotein n=1 Tax=Dehalogenimonas sp. THU2 TaxID=3151121 RepID=UPI003218BFC9